MITSCAPIPFILSNKPSPSRSRSPSIPSAGNRFGTTRNFHPGVFTPPPLRPYTRTSGGVFDSFPAQKGQFFGSCAITLSRRKSFGLFPRSVEIITHRPVMGSLRNSGNFFLLDLFLDYPGGDHTQAFDPSGPKPRQASRTIISCRSTFSHRPCFSLPRKNEFALWSPLFQLFRLSVFQHKLINVVGEPRRSELQSLDVNELLWRRAGERYGKSLFRLIPDLKLDFSGSDICSRKFLKQLGVQRLRLASKNHFRLIQRDHRLVNVPLRVRSEVQRKPSVLFVVRRVKPVIVKMTERKLEGVKAKLQLIALQPDFQNAVRRILVLRRIIRQRMRGFRVWNAVASCFRPCFRACLLAGQPPLQKALAPRRLVHPQQALVNVVADEVVENRAMIADYKNNHSDLVVRHERNLGMESRQIATVQRQQLATI